METDCIVLVGERKRLASVDQTSVGVEQRELVTVAAAAGLEVDSLQSMRRDCSAHIDLMTEMLVEHMNCQIASAQEGCTQLVEALELV